MILALGRTEHQRVLHRLGKLPSPVVIARDHNLRHQSQKYALSGTEYQATLKKHQNRSHHAPHTVFLGDQGPRSCLILQTLVPIQTCTPSALANVTPMLDPTKASTLPSETPGLGGYRNSVSSISSLQCSNPSLRGWFSLIHSGLSPAKALSSPLVLLPDHGDPVLHNSPGSSEGLGSRPDLENAPGDTALGTVLHGTSFIPSLFLKIQAPGSLYLHHFLCRNSRGAPHRGKRLLQCLVFSSPQPSHLH